MKWKDAHYKSTEAISDHYMLYSKKTTQTTEYYKR